MLNCDYTTKNKNVLNKSHLSNINAQCNTKQTHIYLREYSSAGNLHNARHQPHALCAWSITNISHRFATVLPANHTTT